MSTNIKTDKIFDKITSFEPGKEERDNIIRNVMEVSSESEEAQGLRTALFYLFVWTEHLMARRLLGSITLILIVVFVGQQLIILNRIDSLETRMVESNTQELLEHQEKSVLFNSALMTSGSETGVVDSMLVSDRDLRSLIDSYTLLQKQYQDLQNAYFKQKNGKIKL